MVGEAGEDVTHVDHVVGDIDRCDNEGDDVIDLGLGVLGALFPRFLTVPVLLRRNEPQLGGNREVADGEQQGVVDNFVKILGLEQVRVILLFVYGSHYIIIIQGVVPALLEPYRLYLHDRPDREVLQGFLQPLVLLLVLPDVPFPEVELGCCDVVLEPADVRFVVDAGDPCDQVQLRLVILLGLFGVHRRWRVVVLDCALLDR